MPNTPTTVVSVGSPPGKRSARRFFVLDGLPLILQHYYAPGPRLRTPDGEPAWATHRFCQIFMDLVSWQKPDYLVMVMTDIVPAPPPDAGPPHEPRRRELPDDLAPQIRQIREILVSQGIPVLNVPGRDSGDLIATLVQRVTDPDITMMLVSRRKCLHQLLGSRVVMVDPASGTTIGPEELWSEQGYRPEQAVDILTLSQVQGIGAKRAKALIARYGTASEAINHADQLERPIREKLLALRPQLAEVQAHLKLSPDVPLDFNLEACRWRGFGHEALSGMFRRLGFGRLEERVVATMVNPAGTVHEAIPPRPEHLPSSSKRPTDTAAQRRRGGADEQALTRIMRSKRTGLITKADLMQRGWTKSMIRLFIPKPHETRKNPPYTQAAPVCLYRVDVVKGIEKTEAFRSRAAEARKRRASGRRR